MRGTAKVTGNSRPGTRLRLRTFSGARLGYTGCLLIRIFNTRNGIFCQRVRPSQNLNEAWSQLDTEAKFVTSDFILYTFFRSGPYTCIMVHYF